jgi:tetratricopeptide (TPR) repeat protein
MTETSRWCHRLSRAALTVLVAGFAVRLQVSAQDEPLAVVLGRWTTAVMHHTPGTSDAALAGVWAMTPADRVVIRDSLHLFLKFLDGADFSKAKGDVRIVAEAARSLFPLSRSDFLERAATLHADAVIFDTRPPGPPVFDPHVSRGILGASDDWGQAAYFSSSDGEFLNAAIENPNWPLARLLLDELPPGGVSQAFATTWYHGVTAYLLGQGNFGQAETNLNHATRMMPGSAQTLFDLGCVAETQGMNLFQQVILDDRDPLFRGRPGIIGIVTDTSWVTWARVSAPRASTQERRAQAEGLFERALAIDPHLPEARVRWARLLELEKRWTDATRQIGLALSDHPDRDVAFFAHLFGAHAANALNNAIDAEAHLLQALKLFPQAESAILEASDTALTHGDPALAKSRLTSLADPGHDTALAADPWLKYPLGPGRLPDPPLQAMWRAVPGGAR